MTFLVNWGPVLAAGLSILLMGACGVQLLMRLTRVLRGQESVSGAQNPLGYRRARRAPAKEIALVMALAFLSRVLVYLTAYAMLRLSRTTSRTFWDVQRLFWERWDARHYVKIAQWGYATAGEDRFLLVFFPFYPMLMRLLAPLTGGDVFFAGQAISVLCGSASAGMLYALAYPYGGRRTAVLSALYFLLSPLSVFLCSAYTEGLFLCLTLGAMLCVRGGRLWCAALLGMLSAFTRMPGVIVAGMILIDAIGRFARRELTARGVAACAAQMLLVFGGLFLYWGVNVAVTGDPLTYLTYQRDNWYQEAGSFWRSTDTTVYYFLDTIGSREWMFVWGMQMACMFYVYALLAFGQRKLPFDLAAYSFVYTAVVLSPTWLLSGARYLYAMAPLPILQARMLRRKESHALALLAHGVLLMVWIYGFTVLGEVY